MSKIYLLLFFTIFQTRAFSQPGKPASLDSLDKLIHAASEDTGKVRLYLKAGAAIIYQDPLQAIPYYQAGITLSRRLQYIPGMARCFANTYLAYSLNARYDSALLYIDSSIYYSRKETNPEVLSLRYLNRADAYTNLQRFNAALKNCDTAMRYAEKSGNKDRIGRIYTILSDIYAYQNNLHAAMENLDKSSTFFSEINNMQMLGVNYFSKALLLQDMNRLNDAILYYQRAIKIADSLQDYSNLPSYTSGLAQTYLRQKRYAEAGAMAKKSLDYALQIKHRKQEAIVYDLYSNIYLEQKNYKKAIEYGVKTYVIMKEENDLMREQDAASNLVEAYQKAGNTDEAFKYLKISYDLKDSLIKQQYNEETAKLQTAFGVTQKNKEIELLNKDRELQRQRLQKQQLLIVIAIILVLLATVASVFRMNRSKLQQKMKELELRNRIAADLHDEIGSSLSSIYMLSEMASGEDALKQDAKNILSKLSAYAKETMEKMGDIVWMIKPNNTQNNSITERMQMFSNDLCHSRNIQPAFSADNFVLQKLNMQQRRAIYLVFKEAVNNAVKYSGAKNISVSIKEENKHLQMQVTDNGNGFTETVKTPGNGLGNMQRRAEELKGMTRIDTGPEGTIVTFRIPLQ